MHMRFKLLVFILVSLISVYGFAKRPAPVSVEPVHHNNIVYSAPHWSSQNGTNQNGGVIRATEKTTGKLLWQVTVYNTSYQQGLERDVQDVFIKSIELVSRQNALKVTNELGHVFQVNLSTKQVQQIESGI